MRERERVIERFTPPGDVLRNAFLGLWGDWDATVRWALDELNAAGYIVVRADGAENLPGSGAQFVQDASGGPGGSTTADEPPRLTGPWSAPKPGEHESALHGALRNSGPCRPDRYPGKDYWDEYDAACAWVWSQTKGTQP